MFPDAEELVWKLQKENDQVEFFDAFQTIANFNSEGLWMRTITLVSEDELPETAHTFIDENYEISSIIQVQKIEDNKQTISYKVMIMEESDKVSFKFSSDGNLLK